MLQCLIVSLFKDFLFDIISITLMWECVLPQVHHHTLEIPVLHNFG